MARKRAPPPILTLGRDTALIHYEWRQLWVWITTYRLGGNKRAVDIKVFSLRRPTRRRTFRTSRGPRTFVAIQCKRQQRGFIVARRNVRTRAKAKTKTKDEEPEDDDDDLEDEALEEEIKDLEDLEDLEDVEDDEDEDDEPVAKRKRKTKSRAAKEGMIGTAELAELCDIDPRSLRMVLRKFRGQHGIEIDPESGRWQWPSVNDPVVRKIKKLIDQGEATKIKSEALTKLKEQQESKKKDGRKKKKKKREVEEDLDEVELDDEDDE